MIKPADSTTAAQLHELGYRSDGTGPRHDRPLLICDVDEVVMHLVGPFMGVLEEQGFYLKSQSFKLTGNVFCKETQREATQAEVWEGLDTLFQEQDKRQGMVDGVSDALNDLANDIDVLFLTNMPHAYRDLRKTYLASHNMDFPIVTNSGSKVGAMHIIQSHRNAPIGFIDDTPHNLEHARDRLNDIHLFHFMADDAFRNLVGPVEGVKISTGNWQEAKAAIRDTLVVS